MIKPTPLTAPGFVTFLMDHGYVNGDTLSVAEQEHRLHPGRDLLEILRGMQAVSEYELQQAMERFQALGYAPQWEQYHEGTLTPTIIAAWPAEMAFRYTCAIVPHTDEGHVLVVSPDPHDIKVRDSVGRVLSRALPEVRWTMVAAPYAVVYRLLMRLYPDDGGGEGESGLHRHITKLHSAQDMPMLETPLVPGILDRAFEDALMQGASDVHFIPQAQTVQIAYRLDGRMVPIRSLHRRYWPSLCSRLKVLGKANLAEQRLPQNGRFSLVHQGRTIDCRLSLLPSHHGETAVVRLLDQHTQAIQLDQLGLPVSVQDHLRGLMALPNGLLVMVGPTGSGKTSTLHALLRHKSGEAVKIMTLEQPIEYHQPGLVQTEVQDEGPLTFALGVRALLRQDPDVVLLGEVRDEDTAQMALRASLTGHLVLTTLHAGSALGAVRRLEDFGIEKGALQASLQAIVVQRLVRRVCSSCGNHQPSACSACFYTGYRGRLAIAEIWAPTWSSQPTVAPLERITPSLTEQARHLITAGITTEEEIARILGPAWHRAAVVPSLAVVDEAA